MITLDDTKVSLSNVSAKLLSLQNNQFIENRVYEEDETIANISEVPKIENVGGYFKNLDHYRFGDARKF